MLKTSTAYSAKLWVSIVSFYPPLSLPEGAVIIPISQMEELRLREAKQHSQGPTSLTPLIQLVACPALGSLGLDSGICPLSLALLPTTASVLETIHPHSHL